MDESVELKFTGKEEKPMLVLKFSNQDIPAFVEKQGKSYVYYGENNDYPYYLIDLYTQSAYHQAIIDGKVSYICSAGWGIDTSNMNLSQRAMASKMINQPFAGLDLNDATVRWVKDLELFNGFCIKVSWSKNKQDATLSFVDMCNIRISADEKTFFYTSQWFKYDQKGNRKINTKVESEADYKTYPAYDPENRVGEQIYYYKVHHPNQKVYPIPSYSGAVAWINIDVLLAQYFFNTVDTSFVPTHLINFYNSDPVESKKEEIERKIYDKFTGVKGKRIILNFANDKNNGADIQTLQMTDADKQYEAVRKYSEQGMITGHRIPSGMLFGIYREGSLGGRSELMFAEEMLRSGYIEGRQKIMESVINELAKDFGLPAIFKLNKVSKIGYMFDDQTITSVLTPEEKRRFVLDKIGIEPDKTIASESPGAKLLKSINSVSPLVANKVLESLNTAEIRAMIGLNGQTVFNSQDNLDNSDNDLSDIFFAASHDGSKYRLISEREVSDFTFEAIANSEKEFLSAHYEFEIKANSLERQIIDQLSKDSTLQPDALAKIINTSVDNINAAIKRLVDREILSPSSIDSNGTKVPTFDVTEKGATALDQKPAKTAKTTVVYRYGLAPRFKGEDEIISTSRKFCRDMVSFSKQGRRWKSEDIFALDNGMDAKYGQNAWTNRGGWYTKPGTEIHVPVCRHAWIQEIVEVIE